MRLAAATALDVLGCRAEELGGIPATALDEVLAQHQREARLARGLILLGSDEDEGLAQLACDLEGQILDDLGGSVLTHEEEADAVHLVALLQ